MLTKMFANATSTVCFHPPVTPMADYYIIAGVVYQAPDLGTVISSRAVRIYSMIPNHKIHLELCIIKAVNGVF